MKEKLEQIYKDNWEAYIENVRNSGSEPAAFPFLISVPDNYLTSDIRVMICGQETQGWCNKYDNCTQNISCDEILKEYHDFVGPIDGKSGYNSPYWNFINALMQIHPNKAFVMNNIVKTGKRKTRGCNDTINNLSLKYFPVNRKEFELLQPDYIVFLTGPNYDERIKLVLGDFKLKKLSEDLKCLDLLTFEDPTLPTAIRCYHPNYIQRIKKKSIYLDKINSYLNNEFQKG